MLKPKKNKPQVQCRACGWTALKKSVKRKLWQVPDLCYRIKPGEEVPFGACNHCGSERTGLVYLIASPTTAIERHLLDVLRDACSVLSNPVFFVSQEVWEVEVRKISNEVIAAIKRAEKPNGKK